MLKGQKWEILGEKKYYLLGITDYIIKYSKIWHQSGKQGIDLHQVKPIRWELLLAPHSNPKKEDIPLYDPTNPKVIEPPQKPLNLSTFTSLFPFPSYNPNYFIIL